MPRFAVIAVVLLFTALNYEWMPAVLFLCYLLYGFLRPWVSKRWRREIEEEIGEELEADPDGREDGLPVRARSVKAAGLKKRNHPSRDGFLTPGRS